MFTRRDRLRVAVGGLWLIAGLLQLQSFMFTTGFANDVLGTAALSQPAPLAKLITAVQNAVIGHPSTWNCLMVLVELAIGAALVGASTMRATRFACAASTAAGLAIWVVGEGAGGLFTGHAALSTGAPGAALLYAVLSLAAWPVSGRAHAAVSTRVLLSAWVGVWSTGAALALQPSQWGAAGLGSQAAMGQMMSPRWTIGPTTAVMKWTLAQSDSTATMISFALAGAQLLIGLAVFAAPGVRRRGVEAGIALAAIYWVFAQGFGGLSTGTAPDVGTGPVLVLLGVALLSMQPAGEPTSARSRGSEYEDNPRPSNRWYRPRAARGLQLIIERNVDYVERGGSGLERVERGRPRVERSEQLVR